MKQSLYPSLNHNPRTTGRPTQIDMDTHGRGVHMYRFFDDGRSPCLAKLRITGSRRECKQLHSRVTCKLTKRTYRGHATTAAALLRLRSSFTLGIKVSEPSMQALTTCPIDQTTIQPYRRVGSWNTRLFVVTIYFSGNHGSLLRVAGNSKGMSSLSNPMVEDTQLLYWL